MPKKRKKLIKCSKCGFSWEPNSIEPLKTWHLISPMPDKEGRITVTVMGIWTCPNCNYKVKGVVSKIKVGEDTGRIVNRTQLLISELKKHKRISLQKLATMFKFDKQVVKRAIEYLIEKGEIKGRIEDDVFVNEEN